MLVNEMQQTADYDVTVYGNSGVTIEDHLRLAYPLYLEEDDYDLTSVDSSLEAVRSSGLVLLVNSYTRIPALGGVARVVVERKN